MDIQNENDGLEASLEMAEEKMNCYRENGVDIELLKEASMFLKHEVSFLHELTRDRSTAIVSGMDSLLFRYFLKETNPKLYKQLDDISFILSDAIRDLVIEKIQEENKWDSQ